MSNRLPPNYVAKHMHEIEHDIKNFWTVSIINLKTIKKSLVILIKFETNDNAGSLHKHKKNKDI